jgi:hypothetical protein
MMIVFFMTAVTVVITVFNILMKDLLTRIVTSERSSDVNAFVYSILFGSYAASMIVLMVAGFLPFIQGSHAPYVILLIIWILTSVFLFDQVEIVGNLVIDALLYGYITVGISSVTVAGLLKIIMGANLINHTLTWFTVFLVMTVVFRIAFWLCREENHGQGNRIEKH